MKQLIHYFVFQEHSAFMPLRYAYAECSVLIEPHPRVEPLQCYQTSCPANRNCAEITARRIHYLFEEILSDDVEMLFLYFKMRNKSFLSEVGKIPSLGAGVFYKDMREPRWMVMNRWGFNRVRNEGVASSWLPTDEFLFMGGTKDLLIPTSRLVRLDD